MPEAAIPLPVLDDAELAAGLLDIAPSLFGAASLDGRFVRLSRAWEDTLGFPIETLEGSSFLDLVHPEDRDATLDALSRLGDSERLSGFKNRYRTASGDYVWIEWRSRRGLDGLIYFAANDITETVRLRARLEESHQRLDQAAELAGVGGWELRLEDDHLRWDQRTRRIHEVPDDFEPDLDTAISFYSPEARKTIRTAVESGIETGEPWSITLPLITAKKRRIWVRATGRAIPGPDGAPAKLAGTFQDVTEDVDRAEALEAARAALKESEARLQSATEAADVGVWTFRPLEDRIYFSAKCLSILGKGHEEIEMDGAEYASHIHPDDRERVIKAIFEHMAGRADSYIIEARYLHADGRALWTQSFGRVVERDADTAHEVEGKLSQIPLTDLLQLFHMNGRTGTIALRRQGADGREERGELAIRDGNLVQASVGRAHRIGADGPVGQELGDMALRRRGDLIKPVAAMDDHRPLRAEIAQGFRHGNKPFRVIDAQELSRRPGRIG